MKAAGIKMYLHTKKLLPLTELIITAINGKQETALTSAMLLLKQMAPIS